MLLLLGYLLTECVCIISWCTAQECSTDEWWSVYRVRDWQWWWHRNSKKAL